MDFETFPKMARLSRQIIITEKIDGTNAQICIDENGELKFGSRTRWITPADDNYGFAAWATANADELRTLGPGRHFGEWWGAGIQRRYEMIEKQFSLFNVNRWADSRPACCDVVPTLFNGVWTGTEPQECIDKLRMLGSKAAPGYMQPEGIVIYHVAAGVGFKKTIEKDELSKFQTI
jgi:RNA ligase